MNSRAHGGADLWLLDAPPGLACWPALFSWLLQAKSKSEPQRSSRPR